MLGGKRCGKTTVLSSMYGTLDTVLSGTGMHITADRATGDELNKAKDSIKRYMKQFETPLTSCEVDDNPTSAERCYSFRLQRTSRGLNLGGGLPFCIYDIPGEWLTDQNAEKVKALIKNCQVIIIAIDTPYMFAKMTDKGYGRYHEKYNKPVEITNFFKNALTAEDIRDRMILFVPIKCERYYHLDRSKHLKEFGRSYMREVTDAVIAGYRDLILYLRTAGELANTCTIAVTPILSAGGIDFISFREDAETGKMVSYYQAPEFLSESEMGYFPRFCEQPMVYMLTYLLTQACDSQQRNSLFRSIAMGMNLAQMQAAKGTLQKKMKRNAGSMTEEDGYLFIENPKNL